MPKNETKKKNQQKKKIKYMYIIKEERKQELLFSLFFYHQSYPLMNASLVSQVFQVIHLNYIWYLMQVLFLFAIEEGIETVIEIRKIRNPLFASF